MNPIEMFQDLVAQVPALVQPLIIALAGAVPFIDGEGATAIGILGGVNPIVATLAGIVGCFACVSVIVLVTARTRQAVIAHRDRALVHAGGGAPAVASVPRTARQEKFQRSFDRYGVPGVCLLGPLLLPPMFTAPLLVGVGVSTKRVLLWQGVGIAAWAIILAALTYAAVTAVA